SAARAVHRGQSDDRDAGAGLPADDRHDPDRGRLRRRGAEGLCLRGDGILGTDRGPEHAVPPRQEATPGRGGAGRRRPSPALSGSAESRRPWHRRWLVDWIEAGLALALTGLLRCLPLPAASALGGWVARSIGTRLGVSQRAYRNLRLA